jgi:hypothetical protein
MAKTIAYAQAKWERKTSGAGDKWKSNVSGAAGRYAQGVTECAGACGSQTRSAWESGVGAVSAADFNAAISGKGAKWAENYRRGVSR